MEANQRDILHDGRLDSTCVNANMMTPSGQKEPGMNFKKKQKSYQTLSEV